MLNLTMTYLQDWLLASRHVLEELHHVEVPADAWDVDIKLSLAQFSVLQGLTLRIHDKLFAADLSRLPHSLRRLTVVSDRDGNNP
jgi:hypothetical protein